MIQKFFTWSFLQQNPVGKAETASWKNFVSQLENYFFSTGKLFFSSWALLDAIFDAFLFLLVRIFPVFVHFYPFGLSQ